MQYPILKVLEVGFKLLNMHRTLSIDTRYMSHQALSWEVRWASNLKVFEA